MAELTLDIHPLDELDRAVRVRVGGVIDVTTITRFERQLELLVVEGNRNYVIDIKHTQFISSSGYAALVRLADQASERAGGVVLCSVPKAIHSMMEFLGLDGFFSFADDEASAILGLAEPFGEDTQVTLLPVKPLARERYVVVRYYPTMHVSTHYALSVSFAETPPDPATVDRVVQVVGAEPLSVQHEAMVVTIAPRFPGCRVAPGTAEVEAAQVGRDWHFWITPAAVGRLGEAAIEVLGPGEAPLCVIPTPAEVTPHAR